MRFVFILLLCAPLILNASDEEVTNNDIPVDKIVEEKISEEINQENNKSYDDDDNGDEADDKFGIEEIYENAVQAYLDENWDACIKGFNRAIQSYKKYRKSVITCRTECREKASGTQPIFPENIEDLHYYEKKVRETLCLLSCNQDYRDTAGSFALMRLSKKTEVGFYQRNAYDHLHICYYQKKRFQDAANAAYTYLVRHPEHEMSKKNVRYYLSLPEVSSSEVVDLEAEPFVKFYMRGVELYDEEKYLDVVHNLENSLASYLKSEEDCRMYCEGHFDQGWLPEFTPSVANHFAYCLKCKYHCSKTLNNINGEYQADLLPSHYHYLQFAYYKLGDVKNACAAVASYLLFFPVDETMLENKKYYSKLPKVQEDYFTPREEALKYVKRREYEVKLLVSITKEFAEIRDRLDTARQERKKEKLEDEKKKVEDEEKKLEDDEKELDDEEKKLEDEEKEREDEEKKLEDEKKKLEDEKKKLEDEEKKLEDEEKKLEDEEKKLEDEEKTQLKNHPPPGHSPGFQLRFFANETKDPKEASEEEKVEEIYAEIDEETSQERKKILLIADEDKLGGKERYLADGFLNDTECKTLINLAQIGAVKGDGYEGNASPHSTYELFEGLTIGRAALMVYFGLMDWKMLDLALRSTEDARKHAERYFNLDRHLYFTYTHLACRSMLPDAPPNRQDLSHEIHADNCIISDDGTCASEWPAYTSRDYSAIIYLNDDFDGGEFIFAGDKKAQIVQSSVKPRCGRMVAFSADGKNLHGVRGVLRGKRCALALWFTLDKEYLEIERIVARAIIERVRRNGVVKPRDNESVTSEEYEEILSRRIEEDLKLNQYYKNLQAS